jgi:hypothetical protein
VCELAVQVPLTALDYQVVGWVVIEDSQADSGAGQLIVMLMVCGGGASVFMSLLITWRAIAFR